MSCILAMSSGDRRAGTFCIFDGKLPLIAKVAELVDALDLGSSGVTRESSSLSFRTTTPRAQGILARFPIPRKRERYAG